MKGFIFMSKKKYIVELKLEIVLKYLNGYESLKKLSKEYHVHYSDIQKWRDAYIEHGVAGLCTVHGSYTGEFKISVVEYIHNTGASIRKTAAHFNIPSPQSVSSWLRIYNEHGKEALFIENRGKSMMKKSYKTQKNTKKNETNEDLLEEVKRLRMENEYLKKLNALIQEREKSPKSTK